MKTEKLAGLGGIAASVLAAACCIGPAVFVVFGTSVGALGGLAALEAYRSFFLAAAALMLGLSFWRLYLRKRPCDCAADRRARKIARLIWWIGLVVFVFSAAFQRVILWRYG